MEFNQERADNMVKNPSESLNVELKRWIDPQSDKGIAKIAKAAIALRNRNGGYLVIGIDDKTRNVDVNVPTNSMSIYNIDIIQSIISKYAWPSHI